MAEHQFGEIITFYSYKGGTGRSMILANVAYLLATEPSFGNKQVLMIDWDLEAPGLHRYFFGEFKLRFGRDPNNPGYLASLNKSRGLIDFLSKVATYYRDRYPAGDLTAGRARSEVAQGAFQEVLRAIPFDDYVLEVDEIPNLFLTKAGGESGQRKYKPGTPAGSESELGYSEKVRRFNWEDFYNHYGSFFTHFREFLMERYGYVLIDSRTGLTDTGGICTRVMPEKLVTVFVPNRQSIEGLESVIRRAWEYRQNSRDPRGLFVFPVASRLDPSDQDSREAWRRGGVRDGELIRGYQTIFQDLLREIYDLDECDLESYFNATQVPYDKGYAYGERVAARSGVTDSLSIGHACASLSKRLVTLSAPWEKLPDPVEEASQARREAEAAARRAEELGRQKERRVRIDYAIIALVGLIVAIGSTFFYVYQVPKLVERGTQRQLLYLLLLPWALSCAAFLFGAVRSYARFTRLHLSKSLELGGPLILFLLVLVGGLKLVPAAPGPFDQTVRVHSETGQGAIITSGRITMDLDNTLTTAPIGGNGDANFKGIPPKFKGAIVRILPQVDGYEEQWQWQTLKGNVLDLRLVRSLPVTLLTGSIIPSPQKGSNIKILVEGQERETSPDELGRFKLNVQGKPGDRVRLKVYADGKLVYDDYQVLPGPVALRLYLSP